ncbi:MAG: DUF167 domain-containing protein [Acidimicrobiales bacterium]
MFPVALDADGHPVLAVLVQPGASRDGVAGRHGEALKVRVSAPPEAGRANRAVQALLADAFGVPGRSVELVSGATNRRKRFRLLGLTPSELADRLDAIVAD